MSPSTSRATSSANRRSRSCRPSRASMTPTARPARSWPISRRPASRARTSTSSQQGQIRSELLALEEPSAADRGAGVGGGLGVAQPGLVVGFGIMAICSAPWSRPGRWQRRRRALRRSEPRRRRRRAGERGRAGRGGACLLRGRAPRRHPGQRAHGRQQRGLRAADHEPPPADRSGRAARRLSWAGLDAIDPAAPAYRPTQAEINRLRGRRIRTDPSGPSGHLPDA